MSAASPLALGPDGLVISSHDEATLQEGMAHLARMYGWRAQREIVIPGWGRLDLVLHAGDYDDFAYVIEFKVALTRLSAIRKAFQQADGYSRWLNQTHAVYAPVILAAIDIDEALADEAANAYSGSVRLMYAGEVMNLIAGPSRVSQRRARADLEHQRIANEHALALDAHARMLAPAGEDGRPAESPRD